MQSLFSNVFSKFSNLNTYITISDFFLLYICLVLHIIWAPLPFALISAVFILRSNLPQTREANLVCTVPGNTTFFFTFIKPTLILLFYIVMYILQMYISIYLYLLSALLLKMDCSIKREKIISWYSKDKISCYSLHLLDSVEQNGRFCSMKQDCKQEQNLKWFKSWTPHPVLVICIKRRLMDFCFIYSGSAEHVKCASFYPKYFNL